MGGESMDRDPSAEGSDQPLREGGRNEPEQPSNRRRIVIASLLTPPAVMTLNARSAAAQSNTPSMAPKYGKGKGKGF